MIKDNQKYFNRLHVVLDAFVVAVSYMLAWYIHFNFFVDETVGALPVQTQICRPVRIIKEPDTKTL